jgi:hypothetical protein
MRTTALTRPAPATPEEVTAVNITIDRYRQHADLCMSESLRASVVTPMTTGAPFAGIAPAAGQKSALVFDTGVFAGTSAWSPPS